MEVIRKKICLETARSRQQGLLAYIKHNDILDSTEGVCVTTETVCKVDGFENKIYSETFLVPNTKIATSDFIFVTSANTDGNYGEFVCNPYFSGGTGAELFGIGYVSYMDIISRYNKIHNILMSGLKLKKVIVHNDIFYVTNFEDKVDIYNYNLSDGLGLIEESKGRYKFDDEVLVYEEKDALNECGQIVHVITTSKKKGRKNLGDFVNSIDDFEELESLCRFFGGIENIYKFLEFVEDNFIGKLNIPAEIDGDDVPEFLYYCDIVEWYNWFVLHYGDEDCCIKKMWKDKGGDAMYQFLSEHIYLYINALENAKKFFVEDTESGQRLHVPKINVGLFLNSKYDELGVFTPYEEEGVDYRFSGYTPSEEGGQSDRIKHGTANSRLHELSNPQVSHDEYGNELPGLLVENPQNRRTYRTAKEGLRKVWQPSPNGVGVNVEPIRMTVPPDFLLPPNGIYDGATTLQRDDDREDGVYIVSQYSNKLSIPYKSVKESVAEGPNGQECTFNSSFVTYYGPNNEEYVHVCTLDKGYGRKVRAYEMVGDYITDITIEDRARIRFEYVFGGHYWAERIVAGSGGGDGESNINEGNGYAYFKYLSDIPETGIRYVEEYDYEPQKVVGPYKFQDENGEIVDMMLLCDYINFDAAKIRIRHDGLKLEREGLIANITDYTAEDIWRSGQFDIDVVPKDDLTAENVENLTGYTRESVLTPIYKEESLMRISEDIKANVNISINRGNATAFETHYKLSECNSLEDLENYGNNFFNL